MSPSPSPSPKLQDSLLNGSRPALVTSTDYGSVARPRALPDDVETSRGSVWLDRSVENNVLPETAVLGRNLGWSSAYILIISRVIGSGIFATPGAIVRSVGSIGITLVLWVVGALVSWFGLAISLEYGCMLPRSGGEYSSLMNLF